MMQSPLVSTHQDPFLMSTETNWLRNLAQHIIAPITDVTEWYAPIVIAPKKTPTAFGCVLISPT